MVLEKEIHKGHQDTGAKMRWLSRRYAVDLWPWKNLSMGEIFNLLKKIPYREDSEFIRDGELIVRPKYCLNMAEAGLALDCKKKAICAMAWANLNNIPNALIAASETSNQKIHHCFVLMYPEGEPIVFDATLPTNKLNQKNPYITKAEKI